MAANHLPTIEHEIRTVTELQAHHEEVARRAQTEEGVSGDIALECEEKTYQFTLHYTKMKRLYTLMTYVYRNGTLSPELLNSLMFHFQFHYDAEVQNVKKYKTALALEKYLDTMFHRHTELASDLEPRRLTLLRLQEQEQEQEP
jgi:hypothetical protein